MMVRRRSRVFSALLVSFVLAAPSVALAAAPYSTPQLLKTVGFEYRQPGFNFVGPTSVAGESTTAYWGKTASLKRTGSYGFWCAGTDAATGALRLFGIYPARTRGTAALELPELADYFSSSLSYWYVMPSAGPKDSFGVSVSQLGLSDSTVIRDSMPLTSLWAYRRYYVGSGAAKNISRLPVKLVFGFFDDVEGPPSGVRGQGATIDDLQVWGYKFGPVRQIETTWTTAPQGVQLSWTPPQRTATDTVAEDRPVNYRVWRSAAGKDTWTALTPTAGIASTTLTDTTAAKAAFYDYAVQAWDPVDGLSHGPQSALVRLATPGAIWISAVSRPPTSVRLGSRFTSYGTIQPRHYGGSPVRIIAYRYSGSRVVQTVWWYAATTNSGVPATSTKYYRYVTLPARGVWRLRAYHPAHGLERGVMSGLSSAVTVR